MSINSILLLAYTVGSVTGLLLLKTHLPTAKQALNGTIIWAPIYFVALGSALYIGAFALWLGILTRMELSIAYPVAIGLTLVFSVLASWLILSESVSFMRLLGISMILI